MNEKYIIIARPGAKQNKIEEMRERTLKIWIRSRAKEGEANKELIKLLAKHFRTAPSNIKIVRGHKGKEKIVQINR